MFSNGITTSLQPWLYLVRCNFKFLLFHDLVVRAKKIKEKKGENLGGKIVF